MRGRKAGRGEDGRCHITALFEREDRPCVKSFVVSQLGSIFVLSGAALSDAASCMHHYSPNGRRIHSDANAGDGVNCMLL